MPNLDALAEAHRRGILPENKRAAFDEAVSRGLIKLQPQEPLQTGDIKAGNDIMAQNNDWLNNLVSDDMRADWEDKGEIGFFEAYKRLDKWEMLPVLNGKTLMDDIGVVKSFNAFKNGEVLSQEEKDKMREYVLDMAEIQARGYSIRGQISDAALRMPAYIGEFGLAVFTVGAAVPALATKEAAKTGAKIGAKQFAKRAAKGALKKAAVAGGATALMPHRVAKSGIDDYLNDSLAITDKGRLFIQEAEKAPATYAMRAMGNVYIENFSEMLGGELFSPIVKSAGKGVKRVLPKKFVEEFAKLSKSATNKSVQQAIEKFGWNGLLQEIGEERIADLLRTSFDLDQEEGHSTEQFLSAIFPDKEQLLVEIGVLSMFGGASRATQALGNKLKKRAVPDKQIEMINKSLSEREKEAAVAKFDEIDKEATGDMPTFAENQLIEIERQDRENFIEEAQELRDQLDQIPDVDIKDPKSFKKIIGRTPETITQFIKRTGGIRDDGGELKARDISNKSLVGLIAKESRTVATEQGVAKQENDIDSVRQRLFDEGFFPDKENFDEITNDEIFEAIESDLTGDKVFKVDDLEQISGAATAAEALVDFEKRGISREMDVDEIIDVLREEAFDQQAQQITKVDDTVPFEEIESVNDDFQSDIKLIKKDETGFIAGKLLPPFANFFRDFGTGIERAITPISTRLRNIDERVFVRLRRFEFDVKRRIIADNKTIQPFLEKMRDLDNDTRIALDFALKNGRDDIINEIATKNNMVKEVAAVRRMLDEIFARAKAVNMDIEYRSSFFPRRVSDIEGLIDHFMGTEHWDVIQEAFRGREEKLDRALTNEDKIKVVNSLLRGFKVEGVSLAKKGIFKERTIKNVTAELNKYYETSDQALMSYIVIANNAIETSRLFGRGQDMNNMDNLEDSIGAFVNEVSARGRISTHQASMLKEILNARFNRGRMGWITSAARDLLYIDVMGSPLNAITQIGDLATSMYNAGVVRAITTVPSAVINKVQVKLDDIGVDIMAEEFENGSLTSKAVNKVFQLTGLQKIDRVGKLTLVNSAFKDFQSKAKKNDAKLAEQLTIMFEGDAPQVMRDLRNGVVNDNTRFLVFNTLLDMQPMAKSEMPEYYLRTGNLRILYMLKTFTIRQLDIYRREVISNLVVAGKTGDVKLATKAMTNFVRLAGFWVMMGASADYIKDLLRSAFDGDEVEEPEDYVIDNMLKAFGFSKYQARMIAKEGPVRVLTDIFVPPTKFFENIFKDFKQANKREGLKADNSRMVRSIPVGGELYYFWFGGGAKE